MQAAEFIAKWRGSELRERQGSHEHLIDLCHLLGQPTPAEDDRKGERFCFERGAMKAGGGDGWADVWRKGCFGWEYKGKHKDLDAAFRQLQAYAPDLENPPYLVVSDMERIVIRTNWTNTVSRRFEIDLEGLRDPGQLNLLRQVFEGSDRLRPGITPQQLTERVARRFGVLSQRLQERGHPPRTVAHFLNRLVFCMFAEDAELLPKGLFTRTVKAMLRFPDHAEQQIGQLFSRMGSRDNRFFGAEFIRWFNGGLFDNAATLPLEQADLELIVETAEEHDWSEIDPAIFGALFEQALTATRERPALGAHYTDREKILKIVEPVIIRPLASAWDETLAAIKERLAALAAAEADRRAFNERYSDLLRSGREAVKAGEAARRKELAAIERRRSRSRVEAGELLEAYLAKLGAFRVLDPACGSGNFLYVALHALMDLERRAIVDAERLGPPVPAARVGLSAVKGIEIDAYAAELARMTLWIGYLQWNRKNAPGELQDPVLSTLDQIECRDALLNDDGSEAEWPKVDVIIGNPPFLGGKSMKRTLGADTAEQLRRVYAGRIAPFSDFVCYWFEKSRAMIDSGRADVCGLVSTKAIAKNVNLPILQKIAIGATIFDAWQNEQWAIDGAAVRVAIVCFCDQSKTTGSLHLNGMKVDRITPNLTSGQDTQSVAKLHENKGSVFIGVQQSGPLSVAREVAIGWLLQPINPNGRPNTDVISAYASTDDIVGRPTYEYLIDFPLDLSEDRASEFEKPFEYLATARYDPYRDGNLVDFANYRKLTKGQNSKWWESHRSRPAMRSSIRDMGIYLATAETTEHRVFRFLDARQIPDKSLYAFPRAGMLGFGVLQSIFHEVWSTHFGNRIGAGNQRRYNASFIYSTFPFPEGLTPNIPAVDYADDPRAIAIAEAAAELNRLREAWLNPADLVMVVPEIVPTAAPGEAPVKYPDRILPRDEKAARELKKRTLTNLYNERPAWLDNAHRRLDAAVAAAYGWPADLSDEAILERLFALNQERAAAGR